MLDRSGTIYKKCVEYSKDNQFTTTTLLKTKCPISLIVTIKYLGTKYEARVSERMKILFKPLDVILGNIAIRLDATFPISRIKLKHIVY